MEEYLEKVFGDTTLGDNNMDAIEEYALSFNVCELQKALLNFVPNLAKARDGY